MKYIDEFTIELKFINNYRENTVSAYRSDLAIFMSFLNGKDLLNVDRSDIYGFIESIKNKSDKTLARVLTTLRQFYDFLVKKNYIAKSPVDGVEGPKIGRYLPEVLTVDEVDNLLNIVPSDNFTFRNKCILELLYSTGTRISELVNLKLENVDIDSSLIRVLGKGSKERLIPINDITTEYLDKYIKDIRPNMLKGVQTDYLFLNNHGKVLTRQSVFKLIKKRAVECNINKNISPHTLRHSFATHLLQNGADIRFIQELLGHEDVSTTELYTHIANDKLKSDYNDFNPRDN